MGETSNLILNKQPKNLEYIEKLLNYDAESTFLQKAKQWVTRTKETRPHSISEWCEILDSTKNNQSTREFLNKLVEEEALVFEDTRGEPPNEYPRYKLDKTQLEKIVSETPFWNWIRDLSIRIINNQESNKKVVTDF